MMITRACISINNRCNLFCKYCHFHEKKSIKENEMNVFQILDNIMYHIDKQHINQFKLGFVGNGEPLLDYALLKEYILYIKEYLKNRKIAAYTITNGVLVDEEKLVFLHNNNINIGFSIDGIKEIHNKLRCNSYEQVMKAINLFYSINGKYPSMNCTVGKDILNHKEETIAFFEQFDNRVTFSRMIGKYGITLAEFHGFMELATTKLNVRTGSYDCTMYGGLCAAGIDNIFYANGRIYICGNCIDLASLPYETPLEKVDFGVKAFDRTNCYKEMFT